MKVTEHAANILRAFDIEPRPADRVVDAYLRRHRELHSRQRREVAELVFAVLRWRRRLEGYLVRSGVARPDPQQLVAASEAMKRGDAAFDTAVESLKRFPGGAAAYRSYPDFLHDRFVDEYGEDAPALMDALNKPAPTTVRVNVLKAERDEVAAKLQQRGLDVRPTACSPYGLILRERVNLASLEEHRNGLIEIQDEASQVAAMAVRAASGETVLDACAGGGGKALALAMMMEDRGTLVAADEDEARLKNVRVRAKRAGVSSIRVMGQRMREQLDAFKGKCDAVVIDAPCSGVGTLRRAPDLKWRLTAEQLASYAGVQSRLLHEYASWLKPDGRLIYITCSLLTCENEDVVNAFSQRCGFEPMAGSWFKEAGAVGIEDYIIPGGYLKIVPSDAVDMDGFFVAVLRRR